jgi:hypothetical protein
MNLSNILRTTKSLITANSPVLLTGAAIAGVVTTGFLAARGGYQARGIIDEAEAASELPLTTQEKVQLTWLCYAAPAVTGVSAVASVVGVHVIHTKRHAALAGLYAMTTTKLDDYRDKAEELLGSKKSQALNDSIAAKSIEKNPPDNKQVVILEGGSELCHDDWSGRYFMGNLPMIERAMNYVNLKLAKDGSASLNDFYDEVGLPEIPMGDRFGWSGGSVNLKFGTASAPDGRAVISFWFQREPKDNVGVL